MQHGEDSEAAETVDGGDLYLAPGFIDIHSHSDITLMKYPQAESRILQGITTEIGGNCGMSAAPVSENEKRKKELEAYIGEMDYDWNTVGEFLKKVRQCRPSVNLAQRWGMELYGSPLRALKIARLMIRDG